MFQESNQTKAMVEVALALAMGFFSIMVLAMVSMSTGTATKDTLSNFTSPVKVEKQNNPASKSDQGVINSTEIKKTNLIIWFGNQFLDSNLKRINPNSWMINRQEAILAVTPDTNLKHLLDIKERLGSENIKITSLNQEWLDRLKTMQKEIKN
jgi:hypothetical protein